MAAIQRRMTPDSSIRYAKKAEKRTATQAQIVRRMFEMAPDEGGATAKASYPYGKSSNSTWEAWLFRPVQYPRLQPVVQLMTRALFHSETAMIVLEPESVRVEAENRAAESDIHARGPLMFEGVGLTQFESLVPMDMQLRIAKNVLETLDLIEKAQNQTK